MTLVFTIIISVLTVIFIFVAILFSVFSKKEKRAVIIEFANKVLEEKEFDTREVIAVNNNFALAINKKNTTFATIIKKEEGCIYEEINSFFITSIEKNNKKITLTYVSENEKKILLLNYSKHLEEVVYEIYKNAYVKRLGQKYNVKLFTLSSGSDWNCSFVWAYSAPKALFTYYKTTEKIAFYKLNILKEFFVLDTKFNYFEAPIMGINQQLFVYEKDFLDEFYKYLLQSIRQKTAQIIPDKIFFDNYYNIVYLSNGANSLQSLILDKVDDVYYFDNKISFTLKDEEKTVNFSADRQTIEEFDNFVTNYNLKQIANSFDYSTDKLINATDNTKFIVDFTRDRVVYCANLNRFSQFSYITIAFSNLKEATLEKSGESYFVRIHTKNRDVIDITCKKQQVAQYILAQLITIINS